MAPGNTASDDKQTVLKEKHHAYSSLARWDSDPAYHSHPAPALTKRPKDRPQSAEPAGLDERRPIRGSNMRVSLTAFCLVICTTMAAAQSQSEDKKPGDSPHSTGRTVLPDDKGQLQPQGWTGPITTGSGGAAPAGSPQGQSPPGMQAAPEGSSKSIVGPK
jgi:hypothetical protein